MSGERRASILETDEQIGALLRETKTVAVLGIKTAAQADQPAYYVPAYVVEAGFDVYPVPVYYPEATEILGKPVTRTVAAIGKPVDLVDVFRRSVDLPAHLADLIEAAPRAVWLQSGIRNDAFARALVDAGISVVQNRCLMVDLRVRALRGPAAPVG